MVSFGSMNITQAIVDAELRIIVLEKIIERLVNQQSRISGQRIDIDMSTIRANALNTLQEKYPDLGIKSGE